MQLAGNQCAICNQSITFDPDATWCGACHAVFHRDCLAREQNICPRCQQQYDPPERHFVFSSVCPECATPNVPPQPRCVACGAATRWDTQAAYAEFHAHMRDTSHRYLLRGAAEILAACFCVLVMAVSLFAGGAITPVGICVTGFFLLFTDGLVCIKRSRTTKAFK